MRLMRKKRVFRKQPEKGYIFEWVGKDSFCGGSIPTVFNQRWIFLKRDQMKQERDDVEYECEHIWWPTAFARNERASWSPPPCRNIFCLHSDVGFCCERVFRRGRAQEEGKEMKVDLRKKIKCAYVLS